MYAGSPIRDQGPFRLMPLWGIHSSGALALTKSQPAPQPTHPASLAPPLAELPDQTRPGRTQGQEWENSLYEAWVQKVHPGRTGPL